MSDRQASRLEELRAQVEARGQLDQHHRGVREELVEAQYRLRGLELQVQQAEMAVRGLEGFNLDSLVLGLLGRKAQRLEQARQLKTETERQYTECTEAVTTLEREMTRAERQVEQIDSVRQEYDLLLAAKREQIEQDDGEAASELH